METEYGGWNFIVPELIYGDRTVVEYYLPKDVKDQGTISIARVVHGYRYIQIPDMFGQSVASSGGCQVNVNCPEGATLAAGKECSSFDFGKWHQMVYWIFTRMVSICQTTISGNCNG